MLLITSVLAIILNAEGESNTKIKIESAVFSEPKLHEKNQYVVLSMEESSLSLMKPGEPLLPVYTKMFKFPFGTKIKEVDCRPSQISQKIISGEIQPSPNPVPLMNKNIVLEKQVIEDIFVKDSTVYNSEDFYPSDWYDYNIGSGLDGVDHVVFLVVRFYPVRYSPGQNMIQFANKVDIVVEYSEPIQPVFFNDEYDMIVITPSEFSEELLPLIDYKNDSSISTKLVTLDDIYSGNYFPVEGRDDQEKIKYFIKNAIEEWDVSYVLLAGGANKIPVRMSYINDGWEDSFISDLYYADVYDFLGDFCSWDSNENDLFGEYIYEEIDEVDLYPDIHLGRLNFREDGEISSVVNKIITYESSGAYMEDWFSNFVVCGGDTFQDGSNVDEGEYLNQNAIDIMDEFTPEKIWATNGKLQFASNIDNAIENGTGFLYMTGHGTYQNWATHPHMDFGTWWPIGSYYYFRVELLNNDEKLPVVVIGGCSNCEFLEDTCYGWSFVKNPDGGGIAAYGNSAVGWGYTGYGCTQGLTGGMELSIFTAYGIQNAKNTGKLWTQTLNNYLNQFGVASAHGYKTVEEFQPFTDPSVHIAKISNKPDKPDTPDGPISGEVGIDYTYSTSTTEPDGDLVKYCFDWGDDTVTWTDWLESGEIVSLIHSWEIPSDYEIKVKARDENGLDSEWSESLSINITVNASFLIIEKIMSGLGKVNVLIRNIGTLDASDINWSISVVGGMLGFIDVLTENTIDFLGIEEEEKVKTSGIIFGFGEVDISVIVSSPSSNTDMKSARGMVLGPFVFILQ